MTRAPAPTRRSLYPEVRRDPAARRAAASWRRLTGGRGVRDDGRRTLIACSGGCDSSALALCLGGAAPGSVVLAHVVHDLRLEHEALGDRDRARELAERLGVGFVEARVAVRALAGNDEANARRLRYAALGELAREHGCGFVATAHHADDQLETVLMRLIRGAGLAGLAGIRGRRTLGNGVTLVRPMLGITREDAERICTLAGWEWAEDATNADTSRLRSRVRHRVIPALGDLRGRAAARSGDTAEILGDAHGLVRDAAHKLLDLAEKSDGVWVWRRDELRGPRAVVVGEVLRLAADESGGGRDRMAWRTIRRITDAIGDDSTEPRVFNLKTLRVGITARNVRVCVRGEGEH